MAIGVLGELPYNDSRTRRFAQWRAGLHPGLQLFVDLWVPVVKYAFRWVPWFLGALAIVSTVLFIWNVSNRIGFAMEERSSAHNQWLRMCYDAEEVQFYRRHELCERLERQKTAPIVFVAAQEELRVRGWCATSRCEDLFVNFGGSMLWWSIVIVVAFTVAVAGILLFVTYMDSLLTCMENAKKYSAGRHPSAADKSKDKKNA